MNKVHLELMIALDKANAKLHQHKNEDAFFATDEQYEITQSAHWAIWQLKRCLWLVTPVDGEQARNFGQHVYSLALAAEKLYELVYATPSQVSETVLGVFGQLAETLEEVRSNNSWKEADYVTKSIMRAFSLVDYDHYPHNFVKLTGLLRSEGAGLVSYLNYLLKTAWYDVRKDAEMIRTDWLDLSGSTVISQEVTIDKVWERVAELLRAAQ